MNRTELADPSFPPQVAQLAARLRLHHDGTPWSGHMSRVWPVRDDAGAPLALKVATSPDSRLADEAVALQAWRGRGVVQVHAVKTDGPGPHALVLERLDGDATLAEEPNLDAALDVLLEALARLHSAPVPREVQAQLPSAQTELARIGTGIRARHATAPRALPSGVAPRALDGIERLELALRERQPTVLHYDLHFANLLAGGTQPWTVIDPLPVVGLPELELVPLLRNRWEHEAAAGRLGLALEERLDRAATVCGLDARLARTFAQVAAADNVGWMNETGQRNPLFYEAYAAMLRW